MSDNTIYPLSGDNTLTSQRTNAAYLYTRPDEVRYPNLMKTRLFSMCRTLTMSCILEQNILIRLVIQ